MRQYIAPEIEKIEYEVADSLLGSKTIPRETDDIGAIIDRFACPLCCFYAKKKLPFGSFCRFGCYCIRGTPLR